MNNSSSLQQSAIAAVYLIDDSDGDAYLTKRLWERDKIQTPLHTFTSIDHFREHATTSGDFDANQSLLIIDLYLDQGLGSDVLPVLVQNYPQLPVGISTGSEDPQAERDAYANGACFFVGKPLDLTRLVQICEQVGSLLLEHDSDGAVHLQRIAGP